LKRICKDALCLAGAVQETSSAEMLGGQGADFLRRVAFWRIRSSRLLRCFCVTGAAFRILASLSRGRRNTVDRRKSRRIASFLVLSMSKIEEVSQNCFVFDAVKFKN